MSATKTSPECCPFCGAAEYPHIMESLTYANLFRCGTRLGCRGSRSRTDQSHSCVTAERERLTRERDEARAERDDSREAFGNMKQSYEEAVAANINALNQIGDLCMENANLLARVKRLEADWAGWPDLQREWFGDKYAAMQPLEAVRARIEDTEARVKRMEEAGDAIVDHNIGCGCGQDGPCRACRMACEAWTKAKEATR